MKIIAEKGYKNNGMNSANLTKSLSICQNEKKNNLKLYAFCSKYIKMH